MQWIYLCFAILFEVAGTTAMKLSDGLTKLVPSILIFVFYVVSFAFLSFALKDGNVRCICGMVRYGNCNDYNNWFYLFWRKYQYN